MHFVVLLNYIRLNKDVIQLFSITNANGMDNRVSMAANECGKLEKNIHNKKALLAP